MGNELETTTRDADGNNLESPVKHSDVISSMITSDGTDGWDAGTIHDTVFSYTIDEKGIYVRTCQHKWNDNWAGFEIGTVTTGTLNYMGNNPFRLTRTKNSIFFEFANKIGGEINMSETFIIEGNSTTGVYSSEAYSLSGAPIFDSINEGAINITTTTPIGE